ncbi:hypothetical protein LC724_18520 [Blautia sp. RD014234]|nr:hypothetical protein [Blautia parvula]
MFGGTGSSKLLVPFVILGGQPMTVINLKRYYYPLVKTDMFVVVTI